MFDMFSITTDQEIQREKIESLKKNYGLETSRGAGSNYQLVEVFRKNGEHQFALSSKPIAHFCKRHVLQINPSRFKTHEALAGIVYWLMGEEAEFNRIDFCSDLPLSLSDVEMRLKVRNKIKHSEFKSGRLTGLYFGDSKTEIIAVYDKAFLLEKNLRKQKKIRGIKLKEKTRIEVRKKNSKLPFRQFSQVQNYINYNPFSAVQLLDFESTDNLRSIHRNKAEIFAEQCRQIGFNTAYKFWNQSNNFSKTMGKFCKESELNHQILSDHKSSLERYFGGQIE